MSREEKKEYLNGYKKACIKLVALQEQMESLREVGQTARSQQLSDMPKGGKRHKDLSDLVVKTEKLQDRIDDVMIETLQVKIDIEESLLGVKDAEEARVLRLRYIDFTVIVKYCMFTEGHWKIMKTRSLHRFAHPYMIICKVKKRNNKRHLILRCLLFMGKDVMLL